jgi:GNAT superfamily N-acetyltransferase
VKFILKVKIRQATYQDIPQIMAIKKNGPLGKYTNRIIWMNQGQAVYLVIEDDGQILGNVFLKYYGTDQDPDFPNIEDLFIREDKRGQGLGTLLLRECFRVSKEKGFAKVSLAVNPTLNPKAKDLYLKMGFKPIEGREKHLSGVYNGVEDWVEDMVKDL